MENAQEVRKETAQKLEKGIREEIREGFRKVLESYQQMFRAMIMLFIVLLLIVGLLEYFRRVWKDNFELQIPGTNGAIVLHSSSIATNNEFKSAVFVVPASKCWVNTELEIKPGERVRIQASGQVHLAEKLIEQEKVPVVNWDTPAGSPYIELDGIDRSSLLVCQYYDDANDNLLIGNLVGYFLPVSDVKGPMAPSAHNPRPHANGGVFHIGNQIDKPNATGKTVTLWLCVNDLVLNGSKQAQTAYLGDSAYFVKNFIDKAQREDVITDAGHLSRQARKQWLNRKNEWPRINNKSIWDLYYYDNIGMYLVTIEKYTN